VELIGRSRNDCQLGRIDDPASVGGDEGAGRQPALFDWRGVRNEFQVCRRYSALTMMVVLFDELPWLQE